MTDQKNRRTERDELAIKALDNAFSEIMRASSFLMLNEDARYKELLETAKRLEEIAVGLQKKETADDELTAVSYLRELHRNINLPAFATRQQPSE